MTLCDEDWLLIEVMASKSSSPRLIVSSMTLLAPLMVNGKALVPLVADPRTATKEFRHVVSGGMM